MIAEQDSIKKVLALTKEINQKQAVVLEKYQALERVAEER